MPALSHTNSLHWRLYKYRCTFRVMQLQVKQLQTRATSKTVKTGTINVLKCNLKFSVREWKLNGTKVAKEYYWAITQSAGGQPFTFQCVGVGISAWLPVYAYTWLYYSVRTQCQTVRNITVAQVWDGLYFWIRWISALALYSEVEADRSIFVVSLKAHVGTVLLNTPRSYLKFSWFIHYPAVLRYIV